MGWTPPPAAGRTSEEPSGDAGKRSYGKPEHDQAPAGPRPLGLLLIEPAPIEAWELTWTDRQAGGARATIMFLGSLQECMDAWATQFSGPGVELWTLRRRELVEYSATVG